MSKTNNKKTPSIFKRREEDENNIYKYLWRVGMAIESGAAGFTWNEAAPLINAEWHEKEEDYYTSSAYRKPVQYAIPFYENVFSEMNDGGMDELIKLKEEIRKEKQKMFDERTALNKVLREQARRESLYDIVENTLACHEKVCIDKPDVATHLDSSSMIIHLTDVHCGMNIDSVLNSFNKDILSERIGKYLSAIKKTQDIYDSGSANIILGGDLISGIIHINSRIESKENMIEQILMAIDIITEFITEVYKMFDTVNVYSVSGNHSRSTSSKEESLNDENFDLLIFNIIKKNMSNIKGLNFYDNVIASDIASFRVCGHMVYATHGDKDSPSNVVDHMNMFAKKSNMPYPDICYLGHRHKNGMTTVGTVRVIESGCVGGVDSYAIGKRFSGLPEQTITIVTEENPVSALINVVLE